jgi:hypothetical protein
MNENPLDYRPVLYAQWYAELFYALQEGAVTVSETTLTNEATGIGVTGDLASTAVLAVTARNLPAATVKPGYTQTAAVSYDVSLTAPYTSPVDHADYRNGMGIDGFNPGRDDTSHVVNKLYAGSYAPYFGGVTYVVPVTAESDLVVISVNGEDVEVKDDVAVFTVERLESLTVSLFSRAAGGSSYIPNTGNSPAGVADIGTPLTQSFPFADVNADDWFYGDVYAIWESKLMNGTSAARFSPDRTLTRGMAVTVLYRIESSPEVTGLDNPFSDVSAGQYYTEAAIWAADREIILGYTNGTFGPNDNITREQMAAILYRYEQYAKKTLPDTLAGLVFADENSISGYAREAVAKLVTQGIIAGKPNNRFDPLGNMTRAELAAMLHRFIV